MVTYEDMELAEMLLNKFHPYRNYIHIENMDVTIGKVLQHINANRTLYERLKEIPSTELKIEEFKYKFYNDQYYETW